MLKYSLSDIRAKVQELVDKLDRLKQSFEGQAAIQTEIFVLRILDTTGDISMKFFSMGCLEATNGVLS